jgi:hypothetical protein
MTKSARVGVAVIFAAMTFGAAPALANCHCHAAASAGSSVHTQTAFRGGGYDAASDRGVQILRGKVPSNLNAKAARLQSQAIAADRAAFTRASRLRAAQQRAASVRRSAQGAAYDAAAPRRGYRPAYSSIGRVFVRGPRVGARRGVRGNGVRVNRGRSGGFRAGGIRKGGGNRSVSFARRIRS